MNNKYNIIKNYCLPIILAITLTFLNCEKLDVPNLNSPNRETAYADPEDVKGIVSGLFISWYNSCYYWSGLTLAHAADQYASCNGVAAIFDMSREPRIQWNNKPDYDMSYISSKIWSDLYGIIATANNVLNELEDGMRIVETVNNIETDITELTKAWCFFNKGISLGYIGLLFDQGYIPYQDPDLNEPELYPWTQMIDSALVWMDSSLAILDPLTETYTMPDNWITDYNFDQYEFSKLINSYAARVLVYSPRNSTQYNSLNWSSVIEYTSDGLDFDFSPDCDNNFWNYSIYYSMWENAHRIDHRIINLMDPDFPPRWPIDNKSWDTPDGEKPPPAQSDDARLESDFVYITNEFAWPASRGYYNYSNYNHIRYIDWYNNWAQGKTPIFLKAENDLLNAEALLNTGNKSGAISILNDPFGSRLYRGNLSEIPDDTANEDVLKAIFYEREIELINTGVALAFFDMRRRNMLQEGTPLHFPMPGYEVEMHVMPYYTYGGVENADGLNTSNGGWFE